MRRGTWCAWSAWHLLTSSHINFYFLWQAWRLATSTLVLRGRRGTYGSGLELVAPLVVARGAAVLYVAGVALVHINLCFAWQAWALLSLTFVLRGRLGACSHQPSFCVAGVALAHIDLRFAWGVALVALG
jgi:hypothetical protein